MNECAAEHLLLTR